MGILVSKPTEIALVVTAMVLIGVAFTLVYPHLSERSEEPLLDWKNTAVVFFQSSSGSSLRSDKCG